VSAITSSKQSLAPTDESHAQHWRVVLSGLRDKIDPVPVGVTYRLGMLLVAALMILLPLIYIALIVLTAMGVYWYAVHATVIFTGLGRHAGRGGGRAGLLALVAYLGPLVAGGILVLFMIKPLFAKRPAGANPLSLDRRAEPLLFTFVERLCEVVGSPKPTRIDVDTAVNASASFREGWWGFIKKDLVLTIGLPLVAGMELRQFTGVLAHEFGHFAQGTGMRLTFVIRSINNWFARVVYERDAWDEWLVGAARGSEHWAIALVIGLSRLFVWLTRRVLWVLMFVGHAVSSFMLRQMEFDADRYEARVSGSDVFVKTTERLEMLGLASHAAFNDLESAWREKRLCDDLPSLIRSREVEMPTDLRKAIAKHQTEGKTGWFDTHPAHADRIKSARWENAPGIFKLDSPATALFTDFVDLARRATVAFYHQTLGNAVQREHLVATDAMVQDSGRKQQSFLALQRYCQDLVRAIRPVFPPAAPPRLHLGDAAEMLLDLRCKLTEALPRARAAAKDFEAADDELIAVARAKALQSAGERVNAKELNLKKADDAELYSIRQSATQRKENAAFVLREVLADQMLRLRIALALDGKAAADAASPPVTPRDEYDVADEPEVGSADRLETSLRALSGAADALESLRQNFYVLGPLASRLRQETNPQTLIDTLLSRSRKTTQDLERLRVALAGTPYPYPHAEQNVTLAKYAIPGVPPPENLGDVYRVAEGALNATYGLYMRIMSDLAARAESFEQSLGLAPLPEPPDEPN
jgi:Zn-dependent protease with chaperone function